MNRCRAFLRPRLAAGATAAVVLGPVVGMAIPGGLTAQTRPTTARQPTVHLLEAGPSTVAFGYYWSEAPPVLTVRSGDIVEVTTMITNSPRGLERAGVPPDQVQPELRAIYDQVTDRGPGGHILTGPVHVEGAEPGDVLEVRILSVDLLIPYGYNGCSGFMRETCPETRTRIFRLDRERMVSEFAPGVEIPLAPFFGSMGVAPPPEAGRWSS
ncbi:MAG TPA: acetamidase/formamidase family protein, partial [Longimicrobiales bacterium]|nr:acetamidase/formamidase family protein [Longimicrobiales bacterium]